MPAKKPAPFPARDCLIVLMRNLKDRRGFLGLTQSELAERLQCSQSYVSELESGAKQPLVGTLAALALALETSPAALLTPRINS